MGGGASLPSETDSGGGCHTGGRRLFALSDPHLALASGKPMHVFGPSWTDHVERLRRNWTATVADRDVVLVPGDISWGMRLEQARADLEWLDALPGRKILLRGNHDYWWQSLGKMRALGLRSIDFLQNNHVELDGAVIGGSRMWDFPGIHWAYVSNRDNAEVDEEKRNAVAKRREDDPEKIRARELGRLEASLSALPDDGRLRIAMLHFPPLGENGESTTLTRLVGSYNIDICVFGHVHALVDRPHPGADIDVDGTRFVLAASDYLEHTPKYLCPLP